MSSHQPSSGSAEPLPGGSAEPVPGGSAGPPLPRSHQEPPVIRPDGTLAARGADPRTDAPAPESRPPAYPSAPQDAAKPTTLANAFGDIKRTGAWHVPQHTQVLHLFGDVVLDLREALPDSRDLKIQAFGMFGDVKLIVPPGTRVDVSGGSVFGDQRVDPDCIGQTGGLHVDISCYNLFGDIKVKVLEPGEKEPRWWQRGKPSGA